MNKGQKISTMEEFEIYKHEKYLNFWKIQNSLVIFAYS